MSEKLGVIEFFAMEAGEYLEQLDGLLARAQGTPGEEWPRLARALRGAALMANQQPIARAAQAFEQLARAVQSGSRPFDPGTRQLAIRAVDDLKILARGVRAWTDDLAAKADQVARDLEQAGGGRPSQVLRASAAAGPDAGTRAFVAREGATLASALDRAARLLRQQPGAGPAALQPVLQALQPLRGVAGLSDLPPMGELLDGIERAVAAGGAAEAFETAAVALTSATRGVATAGAADADAPETQAFARALAALLEFDQPVVPIEQLFAAGDGPHVVTPGTPPARSQPLGQVDLVSHGEHLRQVADLLDQTPSATRRQLRAYGLAGAFRALEGGAGPMGDAARAFTRAARNAIASGMAGSAAPRLARALRSGGEALSAGSAEALVQVAGTLGAAAPAPAPAAPPAADLPDLAGSYATYHRYVEALGLGPPPLADLLRGPPAMPRPAAAAPAAAAVTGEPVPIATLLYDGPAALDRARQLRTEAADALSRGQHTQASALLEEVLDLVQIGLGG